MSAVVWTLCTHARILNSTALRGMYPQKAMKRPDAESGNVRQVRAGREISESEAAIRATRTPCCFTEFALLRMARSDPVAVGSTVTRCSKGPCLPAPPVQSMPDIPRYTYLASAEQEVSFPPTRVHIATSLSVVAPSKR